MNQTIEKLTINASTNDLEAQFELAQRYAVGNEVRQDMVMLLLIRKLKKSLVK